MNEKRRRIISAPHYEQRRLRMMAGYAGEGRLLDVGCGQLWNPYLPGPGRSVTGLDLVGNSDAKYDDYVEGDVFEAPRLLGNRVFDCILAGEFLEHVERPYDLIRVFSKLLKPGGRLVVSTPNPVAFPVVLYEWCLARRRFYTPDHTYYFPPRWVVRLLERVGLSVETVRGVGLWPIGVRCPLGLSYQVIYVASY